MNESPQKKQPTLTLATPDGRTVATILRPPLANPPDVIILGERLFVLRKVGYREAKPFHADPGDVVAPAGRPGWTGPCLAPQCMALAVPSDAADGKAYYCAKHNDRPPLDETPVRADVDDTPVRSDDGPGLVDDDNAGAGGDNPRRGRGRRG